MFDRAMICGLLGLLGLLALVAFSGAGWAAHVFVQIPSLALVVGGVVLATVVAFPMARSRSLGAVLKNALCIRTRPPEESIATLVVLADVARRNGLLALEEPIEYLQDDFLKRTMRMAVDGADPQTLQTVAQAELEGIDARHATGAEMLRSMGTAAPAFGMIGTLIGLVLMLGQMSDPTKIGPGMAVALLTTLYGLLLANVFCLPLARRLQERSSEELLCKTIVLKGVLAIQAGDNPRIVEQKLRAYLPAGSAQKEFARTLLSKPAGMDLVAISEKTKQEKATLANQERPEVSPVSPPPPGIRSLASKLVSATVKT